MLCRWHRDAPFCGWGGESIVRAGSFKAFLFLLGKIDSKDLILDLIKPIFDSAVGVHATH